MLYFTNSLGALPACAQSGFLLIAWVGRRERCTAGVLNLALAAAVWLLARPARLVPLTPFSGGASGGERLLLAVALFTGLASFIYEIAGSACYLWCWEADAFVRWCSRPSSSASRSAVAVPQAGGLERAPRDCWGGSRS
jgi:hypothetical protein